MNKERVRQLNEKDARAGAYVLYWMQQSQRTRFNPALEFAVTEAGKKRLPIVVCFGVNDTYGRGKARHFSFMLEGLAEVETKLRKRNIAFVVRRGRPDRVAIELGRDAALMITDCGYLRSQRRWRRHVAGQVGCPLIEVEGDAVVPVEIASSKDEYAARTIRPKIERLRDDFLEDVKRQRVAVGSLDLGLESDVDLSSVPDALAQLPIDHGVAPVKRFRGGEREAQERLNHFLDEKIDGYAAGRNEPVNFVCSFISPYLHFGQISPVDISRQVRKRAAGSKDDRASYLEELIVRRELAINHVWYAADYDRFSTLPDWAKRTLKAHADDDRPHRYNRKQLIAADTHDPYWNAAMREMVHTGFMHNYMRMYWGKKILEWSSSPQQAFRVALDLNNTFFLDGRDANSFANVAWCFGLHDRPWAERAIFGTVRYMSDSGLRRKFDMDAYIEAVDALVKAEQDEEE